MLEKNEAHEAVNSAPSKTDLAKLCTSPRCRIEDSIAKIDATGLYYRDLSLDLRHLVHAGIKKIELYNVCGQRYIGTSLKGDIDRRSKSKSSLKYYGTVIGCRLTS